MKRRMKEAKDVRIAIRITKTEATMLDELVERTGMAASDVLRQALRSYHSGNVPVAFRIVPETVADPWASTTAKHRPPKRRRK